MASHFDTYGNKRYGHFFTTHHNGTRYDGMIIDSERKMNFNTVQAKLIWHSVL